MEIARLHPKEILDKNLTKINLTYPDGSKYVIGYSILSPNHLGIQYGPWTWYNSEGKIYRQVIFIV